MEPFGADESARAAVAAAHHILDAAQPCPPAPQPAPEAAPQGAQRLLFGLPLDANRAAPEALEALPGIGPARAQAIVGARPLCRVDDLLAVPGIGPATLARVRPHVAVSPGPGCPAAARGERLSSRRPEAFPGTGETRRTSESKPGSSAPAATCTRACGAASPCGRGRSPGRAICSSSPS
jgi:competence protein ComEA